MIKNFDCIVRDDITVTVILLNSKRKSDSNDNYRIESLEPARPSQANYINRYSALLTKIKSVQDVK